MTDVGYYRSSCLGGLWKDFTAVCGQRLKVRVSRVQGGAIDNHPKISGLPETEPSRSQRYDQVHP